MSTSFETRSPETGTQNVKILDSFLWTLFSLFKFVSMENSATESSSKDLEPGADLSFSSSNEKQDSLPDRPGREKLEALLNGHLKIKMTDGRVLIGIFLCTDRDANVILGSCSEYLSEGDWSTEEPRILGLVMVPGRHIVSIHKDQW